MCEPNPVTQGIFLAGAVLKSGQSCSTVEFWLWSVDSQLLFLKTCVSTCVRISSLNNDADFISLILNLDKEFSFPGSFN